MAIIAAARRSSQNKTASDSDFAIFCDAMIIIFNQKGINTRIINKPSHETAFFPEKEFLYVVKKYL